MIITAEQARELTEKSLGGSAMLLHKRITAAAVGNGKMPRRWILTPCNKQAGDTLTEAGYKVTRAFGYALVRW